MTDSEVVQGPGIERVVDDGADELTAVDATTLTSCWYPFESPLKVHVPVVVVHEPDITLVTLLFWLPYTGVPTAYVAVATYVTGALPATGVHISASDR